jgi:hypothetical protein
MRWRTTPKAADRAALLQDLAIQWRTLASRIEDEHAHPGASSPPGASIGFEMDAAFEAWTRSEAFRAAHQQIGEKSHLSRPSPILGI